MEKRIAVIVPAYNEEKTIQPVVWGIKDLGSAYEPVVVNDCSLDDTTGNAERAGATVIDLPTNLGIGGAVQAGIKYALAAGFDACVQVDGDGQHPPSEIPKLAGRLFEDGVDIVVGSRFLGSTYRVPFMRSFGIAVISFFLRVSSGLKCRDATSGFRAMSRPVMEYFAREYPQDYPEPESLLLAHLRHFGVAEVAVEMNYREHGISSITPIRSVYYMAKVLLAMLIDLFKQV